MRCKSCDKIIEAIALDASLELCNKCYGEAIESFQEMYLIEEAKKNVK